MLRWVSGKRLDVQHVMDAELPDECGHLFRPSFFSPHYAVAPAHGWLRSYFHQDARPAYREYRTYLGLLEGDDPRRLVLKDPFHILFLDALYEAFPDAMVVQTHRQPRESVPSLAKLCTTAQRMVTRRHDVERTAETVLTWLGEAGRRSVERAKKQRDAEGPPAKPGTKGDSAMELRGRPVFDVDYRELVADPLQTVERIHRHFGLPFEEAWRGPIGELLSGSRQRPPNPYSAAEFGLDEGAIDATFAEYVAQFL